MRGVRGSAIVTTRQKSVWVWIGTVGGGRRGRGKSVEELCPTLEGGEARAPGRR